MIFLEIMMIAQAEKLGVRYVLGSIRRVESTSWERDQRLWWGNGVCGCEAFQAPLPCGWEYPVCMWAVPVVLYPQDENSLLPLSPEKIRPHDPPEARKISCERRSQSPPDTDTEDQPYFGLPGLEVKA